MKGCFALDQRAQAPHRNPPLSRGLKLLLVLTANTFIQKERGGAAQIEMIPANGPLKAG